MVYLVVRCGCESRTITSLSAGELMFLIYGVREDSEETWTARRSNQSILKEISSEYSLEGLMLKLKPQYLATWCEELTHCKRPRCWERVKERGEGDDRGWDGWMASLTQWTWIWVNSGSWWCTGRPGVLQFMGFKESDTTEQLNWTKLIMMSSLWDKMHLDFFRLKEEILNRNMNSTEKGMWLRQKALCGDWSCRYCKIECVQWKNSPGES